MYILYHILAQNTRNILRKYFHLDKLVFSIHTKFMADETIKNGSQQENSVKNPPNHIERVERRRQLYRSFEAQALKNRSFFTRISDDLNSAFGSITFLLVNIGWIFIWLIINLGLVPDIRPFDPFPFGFLTLILSIEAIMLTIFILVSQNLQSYVSSMREELHLQVNLIAEEEVTKALAILAEIRQHLGIKEKDPELDEMLRRIDTGYIERRLSEQMQKANTSLAGKIVERIKKDTPDILDPLKITHE